jgi:mannose-6-phosphate isomerase-like protein (cupin superfamily)
MYVLHEPSTISFDKVGIQGKIFSSQELSDKAGFVLIDTEAGHETTIIEHESDFIYYILEGSGFFEINNEKEECTTGDLVVIPAGIKFTYKGKLKMLLVNTPPWREEQEETLT